MVGATTTSLCSELDDESTSDLDYGIDDFNYGCVLDSEGGCIHITVAQNPRAGCTSLSAALHPGVGCVPFSAAQHPRASCASFTVAQHKGGGCLLISATQHEESGCIPFSRAETEDQLVDYFEDVCGDEELGGLQDMGADEDHPVDIVAHSQQEHEEVAAADDEGLDEVADGGQLHRHQVAC